MKTLPITTFSPAMLWALAAPALLLAPPAQADTTVLHHWTLGETDGIVAGPVTRDMAGTLDLTLEGTASRVASEVPASSVAMQIPNTWGAWPFAAQSYLANPATPLVLDGSLNWGFECWAWIESLPGDGMDTESTFIHIGDHTPGSEIMQILNGNYFIHLPGVTLADSTLPASDDLGKWVHLAMVNSEEYFLDEGQNPPVITPTGTNIVRLYRNGAEIASTPGTPNGGPLTMTVGAQKLSGIGGLEYSRGFNGKIDDVRLFTFTIGAFNPETDLLYPDGPGGGGGGTEPFTVTSMSVAGNGDVTLIWNSENGKTYSIWESADLSTWLETDDNVASGGANTTATVTPLNAASKRLFFRVQIRE